MVIPCGSTSWPAEEMRKAPIVIDFAHKQSFGMTYLEVLFNGAVPLCRRNLGSEEVLQGHEELFYSDWCDLEKEIVRYATISNEMFFDIYRDVYGKYSHEAVSDKFLHLAFDSDPLERWRDDADV